MACQSPRAHGVRGAEMQWASCGESNRQPWCLIPQSVLRQGPPRKARITSETDSMLWHKSRDCGGKTCSGLDHLKGFRPGRIHRVREQILSLNLETVLPNKTTLKSPEQSCFVFLRFGFASGSGYPPAPVFNSCFLHLGQAREDGLTVIHPHSLSFVNSESPAGKIIYNITAPLHPNQGKLRREGAERLTLLPCDPGPILKPLGFCLLLYS